MNTEWKDLKCADVLRELGSYSPTVRVEEKMLKGSHDGGKSYMDSHDLRELAAACTEAADWLDARAGVDIAAPASPPVAESVPASIDTPIFSRLVGDYMQACDANPISDGDATFDETRTWRELVAHIDAVMTAYGAQQRETGFREGLADRLVGEVQREIELEDENDRLRRQRDDYAEQIVQAGGRAELAEEDRSEWQGRAEKAEAALAARQTVDLSGVTRYFFDDSDYEKYLYEWSPGDMYENDGTGKEPTEIVPDSELLVRLSDVQALLSTSDKPRDCSSDPANCPDNGGYGCHCSGQAASEQAAPTLDELLPSRLHPPGYENHNVTERDGVLFFCKREDMQPGDKICFYDGDMRDVLLAPPIPAQTGIEQLPPLPETFEKDAAPIGEIRVQALPDDIKQYQRELKVRQPQGDERRDVLFATLSEAEAKWAEEWGHQGLPQHLAGAAFNLARAILANTGEVRAALAAQQPADSQGQAAAVTMNANQLREALNFINPDGPSDALQCEDELTFGIRQHRDDDGTVSTGLCCWNEDTDGVYPLHGDAPIAAQPALAGLAAPAVQAELSALQEQAARMATFIVDECGPYHDHDSNGPDYLKCGGCMAGVKNNDGKAAPEQIKHDHDCMLVEARALLDAKGE